MTDNRRKGKRERGRSLTVRKNATNAREWRQNHITASKSNLKWWWERLAIFGWSYAALVTSTILLGLSFVVWLHMDRGVGVTTKPAPTKVSNIDAMQHLSTWSKTFSWLDLGQWLGYTAASNSWSLLRDCWIDESAIPALLPGDLNKLFEGIAANYSNTSQHRSRYTATVLSSPNHASGSLPWILTLENFLSDDECDALIKLGNDQGFQRSMDVGQPFKADNESLGKVTERRTSASAWCTSKSGCRNSDVPSHVHQRISDLLAIPSDNSEDLQILRYNVGQFYKLHHDYIPHQRTRLCGPRILTMFIYLSDVVAGGETQFPFNLRFRDMNVTIKPKKGTALLFPNVFDSNPTEADFRTRHAALPVIEGTKYAANAWIHLYDYQKAISIGCN
ncbi:2(OG)-Fe(II) oxygenase superfamily protein [Nitzschia inconspicua]|uniref:2(OG)-Fe(II) oxygenase superfamily protein n=1 Tax=Nitzschia inconspicua TaxID=303405 RepID=A0A9K3P7Y1_9STRA|nr:2OG-Fe(II) oxygenase superfamily-domain containing protein [Nitzschia inconspicua]KAG7368228.1 2(OG)-Fe(II) oxygenase superfamily protein [Nitzschia inconspicua]